MDNKQAATVDGVPATDEPASHRKRKKDGDSTDKSELIESLDRMTRNTGLADITRAQTDMTRAQTSGLAELICAQEKQDDAMTKYSLLSYDTTDPQKKALYESMAVKAKNRYNILEAKVEKLAGTTSIDTETSISNN